MTRPVLPLAPRFSPIAAAALAALLTACASRPAPAPMTTVPSVDISRYTGTWHEAARLPNRFQRHSDRDTTATYTLRPDGRLTVLNATTRADGARKQIRGTASVVPGSGNARLRVTFFWPFTGDYWIIGLDEKTYEWAVVGHPSRNYLWFLTRSPQPAPEIMAKMRQTALAQGYTLDRLIVASPAGRATPSPAPQ